MRKEAPDVGGNAPKPRTRLRRLLRLSGRALLAAALLLVGLYLLRIPLFSGTLARHLASQLSEAADATVSIERVEGGWISDMTLVGVTWRSPPETPVTDVRCSELRVEYRLWDVLTNAAAALRTVTARGVVLTVDARDRPGSDDDSPGPGIRQVLDAFPSTLRSVRADGTATIRTDQGDAGVGRFDLDLGTDGATLELADVTFPLFGQDEHVDRFTARVERAAPGSLVATFEGTVAEVRPLRAQLDADEDGTVQASVELEVADGDVEFAIEDATLTASCDVDLGELPAWIERAVSDLPRAGRLAAEAVAERDGEALALASLQARATDVSWRGAGIETCAIDLRRGTDGALLGTADVETAGAALRVTEALVDLEKPYGIRSATLTFGAPDVDALLTTLDLGDLAAEFRELRTSVDLRGALRDARRFEVDALSVRTAMSRVDGTGHVVLPEDPARVQESGLHVDATATVDLQELVPKLPADWELPATRGALRASLEVRGSPAAPRGSVRISGDAVQVDGREVRELTAAGQFAERIVRGASIAFATSFATLEASGDLDLDEKRVRDGRLKLRAPALETLAETFAALPSLAGSLDVTGTFDGPLPRTATEDWMKRLDGIRAQLTAEGAALRVDRFDIGELSADASLEWPVVQVERLRTDGPLARIDLTGNLDLRDEAGAAKGRATFHDLKTVAPLLPALPPLSGSLEIEGDWRKDVDRSWLEPTADAELRGERLRIGDHDLGRARATLAASGGQLSLSAFRADGPWGSAEAAGTLHLTETGGSALVTRLRIDADDYPPLRDLDVRPGPIELQEPARIEWTAEHVHAPDVAVTVLGGRARASVRVGNEIDARLDAEELDLERLPGGLAGRAGVLLEVTGPPNSAIGSMRLDAPDLRYDGERGSVRLRASQAADGMHVDALSIDLGEAAVVSAEGRVPVRLSRDGLVEVPGAPAPEGRLRLVSERPAHWLRRFAPEELDVERVELVVLAEGGAVTADVSARTLRWTSGPAGELVGLEGETRAALRAGPDGLHATVIGAPGGPLRANGEVRVGAAFDWLRPMQFADRVRSAVLTGHLDLDAPDISALARWVEPLVHSSGKVRGKVTLGGTVSAPTWSGSLEGEDLALRLEGDLPTVGGGALRVTFDEREVRLERLDAFLGYAPLTATGVLTLTGEQPRLDARLQGENVLLARSPDLRLRADVDLAVTGGLDALLVSGRLQVTDALYSRAMDLFSGGGSSNPATQLFSLRDPPLSEMRFDVHVLADETLRIENNVLNGAFSADVRLRGTGAVPEPEGRLDCREVRVQLPLTRLVVDRGSIEFPPGNPFDPRIRASAATRLKGYDLQVQLTGPVAATRVQIASSPALTQEEALLLLATGATPRELSSEGIESTALGQAGTMLGGTLLSWVSGPSDPDAAGFADRLTVDFGREQSRSGASTIDAELELAERWYLRFERDRYDDYNAGIVWRLRFR